MSLQEYILKSLGDKIREQAKVEVKELEVKTEEVEVKEVKKRRLNK